MLLVAWMKGTARGGGAGVWLGGDCLLKERRCVHTWLSMGVGDAHGCEYASVRGNAHGVVLCV